MTRLARSDVGISPCAPRLIGGRLRLARGTSIPWPAASTPIRCGPLLGAARAWPVPSSPASRCWPARHRKAGPPLSQDPAELPQGARPRLGEVHALRHPHPRPPRQAGHSTCGCGTRRRGPRRAGQVGRTAVGGDRPLRRRLHRTGADEPCGERSDSGRLRGIAHGVASAFADPRRAELVGPPPCLQPAPRPSSSGVFSRGNLLSLAELAAVAHLPFDDAAPGVVKAGAKATAPPPKVLTRTGHGLKPLGIADAGGERPIGIPSPTPGITCTSSARPAAASPR